MIYLDEEEITDIIDALRGDPKHLNLIASLDNMRKVSEENKKEQKELENQEIWIKCFFNGYFYKFIDMNLSVDIRIENPDFPEKSSFKGTTCIFAPLNEQDGDVDLTPLLHSLLLKMKENPTAKVKAFATGFSRQMHFNKDLLSTPIPQSLIDLFKTPNGIPKVSNALQNVR